MNQHLMLIIGVSFLTITGTLFLLNSQQSSHHNDVNSLIDSEDYEAFHLNDKDMEIKEVMRLSYTKEKKDKRLEKNNKSLEVKKEIFFNKKKKKIKIDEFGNHVVNATSQNSESMVYLVSYGQIYFPTEWEMNGEDQLQGCANTGGYYVANDSEYTLISAFQEDIHVFHYRCVFDEKVDRYVAKRLEQPSNNYRDESIRNILKSLEYR